jgi:hypothetical protein
MPIRSRAPAFATRSPDAGGALGEGQEAPRLGGAGETPDGLGRLGALGEEVQPTAVAPGVAREHTGPGEGEVLVEHGAGLGKNLFEDPAHGEHRGAGIHPRRARGDLPQLAARRGLLLHHLDVEAPCRQQDRRRQTPNPGADHHHPLTHLVTPVRTLLTPPSIMVDSPD